MDELLSNKRFRIIGGIVVFLIITLIIFLIFRNPPEPPQTLQAQGTLLWWNTHSHPIYQEIVADFNKLYEATGIDVELKEIDYQNGEIYYQNLLLEMVRGTAPDIFTLKNDDIPAFREFLMPMTGLVYQNQLSDTFLVETYKSEFVDLVVKDTVYRDEIFGVTTYVDNLQLYFNKDILNQSGIPVQPKTWTDLETTLSTLNKRETDNLTFSQSAIALGTGLNVKNGDLIRDTNLANFQDIVPTLIFQNGNPIYDSLQGASTLGSDKNQTDLESNRITDDNFFDIDQNLPAFNALEYFLSFTELNNRNYSWSLEQNNSREAFLQGRVAYLIDYRGFENIIQQRNSRLNYGVTELPQLDLENKKTYGKYFVDVLNNQLQRGVGDFPENYNFRVKKDVAKEFLYYLSTSEVQEKINAARSLPASRKNLIDQQKQGDKNLAIFADGALYADNYYKPDPKAVEAMWGELLYSYHYENVPLEEALSKAVSQYNLLIQKGPKIDV